MGLVGAASLNRRAAEASFGRFLQRLLSEAPEEGEVEVAYSALNSASCLASSELWAWKGLQKKEGFQRKLGSC